MFGRPAVVGNILVRFYLILTCGPGRRRPESAIGWRMLHHDAWQWYDLGCDVIP